MSEKLAVSRVPFLCYEYAFLDPELVKLLQACAPRHLAKIRGGDRVHG